MAYAPHAACCTGMPCSEGQPTAQRAGHPIRAHLTDEGGSRAGSALPPTVTFWGLHLARLQRACGLAWPGGRSLPFCMTHPLTPFLALDQAWSVWLAAEASSLALNTV